MGSLGHMHQQILEHLKARTRKSSLLVLGLEQAGACMHKLFNNGLTLK